MIGLLGNKIGMTQIFDERGQRIPVTVIKTGPCFVTQIKLENICGYNAIQLGYIEINNRKIKKPNLGHFLKNNLKSFRYLKEYKLNSKEEYNENNINNYKIGQKLDVKTFKIGQYVNISGLTIGKGNAGNIKKNNFNRGPMSHGSKHHRLQGSLGAGTSPGRVFPGKKMPGRLGMKKCTIKNLYLLDIDYNENIIVIKGSIPGKIGSLVNISNAN